MMGPRVQGFCPMGCGETLLLDPAEGTVYCSKWECPQENSVTLILSNPHIEQHVVEIRENDFTVKHPLRERIEDDLFSCELNQTLSGWPSAQIEPGLYRTTDGTEFEKVE